MSRLRDKIMGKNPSEKVTKDFDKFLNTSLVNVKVSVLVKERLTVLQGFLQIKAKKKVSLSKTIEHLLDYRALNEK